MGSYDQLTKVTMNIRGLAPDTAAAERQVEETLRRFVRDDVERSVCITVAPIGYEAEVTLWPASG